MHFRKLGYILTFLLLSFFAFFSCQNDASTKSSSKKTKAETLKRDLPEIKKEGKLKAITTYGMTSYFLYRGKAMGFEYELLKTLANHLNLELELTTNSFTKKFLPS